MGRQPWDGQKRPVLASLNRQLSCDCREVDGSILWQRHASFQMGVGHGGGGKQQEQRQKLCFLINFSICHEGMAT